MARRVIGIMLCLMAAGCGSRPEPKVPLKGHVKDRAGKPLTGVMLTFYPDDPGAYTPSVIPEKDGGFRTTCTKGRYRVVVGLLPAGSGADGLADPSATRPAPAIPEDYRSKDTTPWVLDVPAGGKEDVVLAVGK